MDNFPKIESPFIRYETTIDDNEAYIVYDEVREGYEWVFEDPSTIATEKLDGTNVQITTNAHGEIIELRNRSNILPVKLCTSSKPMARLYEGIIKAIGREYVQNDCEQAGELIGPNVQGNPYGLDAHLWYPFWKARKSLVYKSFHKYERTFENLSSWFQNYLFSLFYSKHKSNGKDDWIFAEGVVFYNAERHRNGQTCMAKLRRDMFDWYYRK